VISPSLAGSLEAVIDHYVSHRSEQKIALLFASLISIIHFCGHQIYTAMYWWWNDHLANGKSAVIWNTLPH